VNCRCIPNGIHGGDGTCAKCGRDVEAFSPAELERLRVLSEKAMAARRLLDNRLARELAEPQLTLEG
jgi:hypothetical protein